MHQEPSMTVIAHIVKRCFLRAGLPVALAAAAAAMLAWATPALAADQVYWANQFNDSISYANLDGSGGGGQLLDINDSNNTVNYPSEVALDPAANTIYWANDINNPISYVNLDGTGNEQLNIGGATASYPSGVAIDPGTNTVYWTNLRGNAISYANLDGTGGGGQLDTTGATVSIPHGLVIDPSTGKIYWANQGNNTISYANLDGTGDGGQLSTTGATPADPQGPAVDPATNTIYWANAGNNTISYAKLDGSGGGQLNTSGETVEQPNGVAIDPDTNTIYWGNGGESGPYSISYANLDGSGGGGTLDTAGATLDNPQGPALLVAPTGTGAPTVTGGSLAGSTLACSGATWAPDVPESSFYQAPSTVSYSWTLNGLPVPGATASTLRAHSPGNYTCQATATNHAGSSAQTSMPYAVQTEATSTTVASSANPSTTGQLVTYAATVSPAPDGGTVAFTDDGLPLSGCGAVTINTATGDAICQVTYNTAGSHTIQAGYSGDTPFTASQSALLTQTVSGGAGTTSNSGAASNSAGRGEKPSCTLRSPRTSRTRAVSLTVRCDQTASVTLSGNVTLASPAKPNTDRHKTRPTTIELAAIHRHVTQNHSVTLMVKLPSHAFKALESGARETVILTLTVTNANGATHASKTLTLPSL
jgi:DNA-binding beta-propeller fold protein YncE